MYTTIFLMSTNHLVLEEFPDMSSVHV